MTAGTPENSGFNSTYPASWAKLPGTDVADPGPEHPKAVEQEYYLADGGGKTTLGHHTRDKIPGAPKSTKQT